MVLKIKKKRRVNALFEGTLARNLNNADFDHSWWSKAGRYSLENFCQPRYVQGDEKKVKYSIKNHFANF